MRPIPVAGWCATISTRPWAHTASHAAAPSTCSATWRAQGGVTADPIRAMPIAQPVYDWRRIAYERSGHESTASGRRGFLPDRRPVPHIGAPAFRGRGETV